MLLIRNNSLSEKKFSEMIVGKTVAVVGPSRSIIGDKKGEYIDSHDLVVRFNYMFPVTTFTEDLGTRTDILYHCFCRRNIQEYDAIQKLYDPKYTSTVKCFVSVKTLWNGVGRCADASLGGGRCVDASLLRDEVMMANNLPHYIIPDEYLSNLREKYKITKPTLGILALDHLLKLKPKSLFLTGFTAHKDPYYEGYNDKLQKNWNSNGELQAPEFNSHNIEEARLVLKQICQENKDVIIIGKKLQEIIQ